VLTISALLVCSFSLAKVPEKQLENYPELQRAVSQSQRQIRAVDGAFSGAQPGQFQFQISPAGRLAVSDLTIRTVAFGNGHQSIATVRPSAALGKDNAGHSKLSFTRPGLSEWYVNETVGLHHWFQIDRKVGDGNLWVKLATSGVRGIQTGPETIQFSTSQGSLSYAGLKVWDASGRKLAASMQLRGSEIVIGVDDASAVYPITIDPTWSEQAILTASDKSTSAYFGAAVAIEGDTAIIGAPYTDPSGTYSGSVYVFTRTGSSWTEQQILTASDKSSTAEFGFSVAISGDTAVIGARFADPTGVTDAGSAYVFTRSGGTWSEQQVLSAADEIEFGTFGHSVAISGDTVLVGSPNASPDGANFVGAAYLFTRSGGNWNQQQVLSASDKVSGELDYFGISVGVSGDTAIIGAYEADAGGVSDSGAAYIFTGSGGVWSEQQKLSASDKSESAKFGNAVAISGDRAVVGAYLTSSSGLNEAGAAYVFARTAGTWSEQQVLSASDKAEYATFGYSVALSGGTVVVGAPDAAPEGVIDSGTAYTYTFNAGVWTDEQILSASDKVMFGNFGASVSISGDTAIFGAPEAVSDGIPYTGAAYVYQSSTQATVTFPFIGVTGGKNIVGTVTLSSAPVVDTIVNLSSNSSSLTVPASVMVLAGTTTATFTATSALVTSDTPVTVTASGADLASDTVDITVRVPRVSSVSFSADFVTAGETAVCTVTLQAVAPPGGILVTLTNSDPSGLSCPATVVVPAGQTKVSFTATGNSVGAATTVKVEGTPSFNEKSDTITVNPASVHLTGVNVPNFVLGSSTTGQVTLSQPALAGGALVSLAGNSAAITLPSTVLVPEGATSASFSVSSSFALQNATVTASYLGSTKTDLVSALYVHITSIVTSHGSIAIGADATITVTLNVPTPQDLTVTIFVQKPGVVSAPTQLVIPAGSTTGSFQVTGTSKGTTNVYGTLPGQGTKSAKIVVTL
jgi:hypothetical protein